MTTDRASFPQDISYKRIHSGAFLKTLKYLLKLIRNILSFEGENIHAGPPFSSL